MLLDRTKAPEIADFKPFKLTRANSIKLSNGIDLHFVKSGTQPLLKFELVFQAGNYAEPQKGVSFFTAKMLNEGTKSMSNKEIAEKIAFFGANIDFIPGLDKITISVTVLEKHFYNLLTIVSEIIEDSVFQEKNFESIKNIYLQQLKVSKEKTSFVATGLFKQTIFGTTHPYGYFIEESEVSKIEAKDCLSYYKAVIKDCSFEIIASGMVSDEVLKAFDKILGQKKCKPVAKNETSVAVRAEKINILYEQKADAVQSSLRIGKRLFTRNHPDFLKTTVLNEILGGYFGSRLMKVIREEKGLTYGIYSQVVTHINDGYFVIGSDVKKELIQDALNEIYIQIERLKNEEIEEEELQTVKNYMIGSYLNAINTPFALADKFKTLHFNGLSYEYYDNYIQNIQKVTSKDLQGLAKKYFDKTSFAQIVVG